MSRVGREGEGQIALIHGHLRSISQSAISDRMLLATSDIVVGTFRGSDEPAWCINYGSGWGMSGWTSGSRSSWPRGSPSAITWNKAPPALPP